tara:strand:+ start:569 stop:1120 length:552 start_codon:yes stop_codon:yes gene_type:complete
MRKRYRNGGLITRGSGRIDPSTGHLRLTVDDVPARIRETGEPVLLGANEYVVNSGAVRKLGVPFLDNLNAIGLGNSTLPRGTGYYGNYQIGGIHSRRRGRLRSTRRSRYEENPGIYDYQRGGRTSCPPGTHMMPDGTCMRGAYHGAPGKPGNGYQRGGTNIRRHRVGPHGVQRGDLGSTGKQI